MKIPKPQFTNSRRKEAEKNARIYSLRMIENSVRQLCEHKRDTIPFELREMRELEERGASKRLAQFMQADWDFNLQPDVWDEWTRYSRDMRRAYAIETMSLEEILVPDPVIPTVTEIGSYSPSELREALKALYANADEIPYSGELFKSQHLIHMTSGDDGLLFFVGNPDEKPDPVTQTVFKKSSESIPFTRVSFGIEHLTRYSVSRYKSGKIGLKQHPEGGILDIECVLNEERGDTPENLISLAIDFSYSKMIIKVGAFRYRFPLLLAFQKMD